MVYVEQAVRFVLLVSLGMLVSCGTAPGSVTVSFTWEGGQPADDLWIFGRVMQVSQESPRPGNIISEMEAPQQYGTDLNLSFPGVQNQENLIVLLEARADSSLESRPLYYGISKPFSLNSGSNENVEPAVSMTETPEVSSLAIEEAGGPADCPGCYTSTEIVTIAFVGERGTSIEIANDSDFTVCRQTLSVATHESYGQGLVLRDEGWAIEGWSLDCGLDDTADGPRNVYLRLLDDMAYPSQVLSANVIVDREPPSGGTLYSSDTGWQEKAFGTVMFTVKGASEMWLEACTDTCSQDVDAVPDGLSDCGPLEGSTIPFNSWTEYQTQACIRLKDQTVRKIRVKYRDMAGNETPWLMLELAFSDLQIKEAVGPLDCPGCYVSTANVTLEFAATDVATVQVANDTGFSTCKTTLTADSAVGGVTLSQGDDAWRIQGWNLNCDLAGEEDGLRNAHVRVLDAEGYPAQTYSAQAVLDTKPPTGGTLACVDGVRLVKLSTVMLFGAVKADEMWIEACESSQDSPGTCEPLPGGIKDCASDEEHYVPTNSWADYATKGCIRLANESIRRIRVKYRDYACNETKWVEFEFEHVEEFLPDWVAIPAGTFEMGCSEYDFSCSSPEFPVHAVEVQPFFMLATEVTEGDYLRVVGTNPACGYGLSEPSELYPVECVDGLDAEVYCEAIGGRLCTEAEWEYAARAGTNSKYYCGESTGKLGAIAWFYGNSGDMKHEVAQLLPNGFGLYDMLGNVQEWTADCWHDSYDGAPDIAFPGWGPSGCGVWGTVRGGYFGAAEHHVTASHRTNWIFGSAHMSIGFRCCKSY